ncbi:MAG: Clp protease N-terminal domain-containing protein [Candidatus Dormibacteria bacterium]
MDTAHLLLAITSDPADPAYRILQTLGVDPALIPGELERLDQAS